MISLIQNPIVVKFRCLYRTKVNTATSLSKLCGEASEQVPNFFKYQPLLTKCISSVSFLSKVVGFITENIYKNIRLCIVSLML